jgi:hypothetical protein
MFGISANRGERGRGFGLRARVSDFGETKIQDFCVTAFDNEDIGGLDVTVNDAFSMGGIEGVGNLDGDIQQTLQFHRPAGDCIFESLALKTFHGDEGFTIFFADVMDGADVGMVQRRGSFGFAAKAAEGLRIPGEVFGEKFKSDEAVEAGILCFVDYSHSAAAQHLDHTIVRDGLPDE